MGTGLTAWIAAHGYLAVASVLFVSALGVPAPAALSLVLAGAAAHGGAHASSLHLPTLILYCIAAESLGATLLFWGGRLTGWWLLGRLCRLTMDPEVCIFRSADFFYEHGASTLLYARFVPGLNSMAPPLAGSLNMRPFKYWRMDILGAALHVTCWTAMGYLLSHYVHRIEAAMAVVGHVVISFAALILVGYIFTWVLVRVRDRRYKDVERVSAREVIRRLEHPDPERPIVIADVRSHGYYDPGMQRIKNSIRVEPNRLGAELQALRETLAPECDIYVYCSCLRDATSLRIAHALGKRGTRVRVIEGGLREWVRSGAPTEIVPENELHHLPQFD